jgi:hypothetical protein
MNNLKFNIFLVFVCVCVCVSLSLLLSPSLSPFHSLSAIHLSIYAPVYWYIFVSKLGECKKKLAISDQSFTNKRKLLGFSDLFPSLNIIKIYLFLIIVKQVFRAISLFIHNNASSRLVKFCEINKWRFFCWFGFIWRDAAD